MRVRPAAKFDKCKMFQNLTLTSFRDGKPAPSVPEMPGAIPDQFPGVSKPNPFPTPDTNGPVSDYINRLSFIYGLSRPSMFNPYVKVRLTNLLNLIDSVISRQNPVNWFNINTKQACLEKSCVPNYFTVGGIIFPISFTVVSMRHSASRLL